MQTVPDLLAALVLEAIEAVAPGLGLGGQAVQATQDASLGDYQSNLAFRLTKVLRKPPVVCAQAVVDALPSHPALRSTEVVKGFINLRLDDPWIAQQLLARVQPKDLSLPADGTGQRVVIDYGSPNVAKRMHVGHLRSTNIGDALANMMRALGYDVVGDNHIGDWGTQFGKLMVAWELWRDEDAFAADAIGELQRLYVRFGQEAGQDPSLEGRAREETAALQTGEPRCQALWRRFVEASLVEFDGVYTRMGVRFDETLGESFYQPMLVPLVEDLRARGLAEEDDGAVLVRFDEADGKGLSDSPMLVRKRDGAALYATTDLAALRYRQERWTPDTVVYVTDVRQQLHFRQVFAAARKAGLCDASMEHVWFGMLTLPEGVMANRRGNVIRLEALLDEAARRARAVVDAKSPELPEEERAAIAEAVGVSAVRYADLSQNPQSNVVFSWDRMLSLEGNTAPFLMYSYARCRSIQRKAGLEAPSVAEVAVAEPAERELALALLRFPEALRTALAARRPNMLCDYLYGLAGAFNRFYYQVPVLRAESGQIEGRLGLVEATARVLGTGMALVGVRTLDRM